MANQNFAKTAGFRSAGHIYIVHHKTNLPIISKHRKIARDLIPMLYSKFLPIRIDTDIANSGC